MPSRTAEGDTAVGLESASLAGDSDASDTAKSATKCDSIIAAVAEYGSGEVGRVARRMKRYGS